MNIPKQHSRFFPRSSATLLMTLFVSTGLWMANYVAVILVAAWPAQWAWNTLAVPRWGQSPIGYVDAVALLSIVAAISAVWSVRVSIESRPLL